MNDEKISLVFAGDYAPCRRYEDIVLSSGEKVFGDAYNLIKEADVSFVNLECPLTFSDEKIDKIGPNLKANPNSFTALNGFDVVGLANNHIMDYGVQGLADTIKLIENSNSSYVGADLGLDGAEDPFIKIVDGVKIALIAFAEEEFNIFGDNGVNKLDAISGYRQIVNLRDKVDIIIVSVHGGNEFFPFPRPSLRKLCRFFVDVGADAVICHHSHVPGAYEQYSNGLIFYSLGNIIFDSLHPTPEWHEGILLKLVASSKSKKIIGFELVGFQQSVDIGGVRVLKGDEKKGFCERIEERRRIVQDDERYRAEWLKFVRKNKKFYYLQNYFPWFFKGVGRLNRYFNISSFVVNKSSLLKKLNIVRCDSHHEILKDALEMDVIEKKND